MLTTQARNIINKYQVKHNVPEHGKAQTFKTKNCLTQIFQGYNLAQSLKDV